MIDKKPSNMKWPDILLYTDIIFITMNLLVHDYIFISNRQPNRFSVYIFGYEVDVRSIAAMCCVLTGKILIDM